MNSPPKRSHAARRPACLRVATVALALHALGCAGRAATSTTPTTPTARVRLAEVHAGSGVAFDALPFDTDGYVRIAAYVRGGARDSSVPGTSTLAAMLLARAVGPGATGVATSDAIEIAWVVERPRLDEAVAAILTSLATRRFDDGAYARARDELLTRREAATFDSLRQAEAIAAAGVLGLDPRDVDPLGAVADPIPSRADVETFVAASVLAARTVLIAAGELSRSDLEHALERARTRLPAGGTAAPISPPTARTAASGAFGARPVAVVATLVPEDATTDGRVAAIERAVASTIEGRVAVGSIATREGRLVTVRAATVADPFDAVVRIAREIGIALRLELPQDERERDVVHASRAVGFRSATASGGEPTDARALASRPAISAYVEVRAPRVPPRDERSESDAEAALATRARDAIAQGLVDAAPSVVGNITPESAEVVVGEGVVVRASRTSYGHEVGIAIRFEPTVLQAPGLAPVLARALARSCGGRDALPFVVDARGIAVVERATAETLSDVVERLLPCVLEHVPSDAALDEALRTAITAADTRPLEAELAALSGLANQELASILVPLGARASLSRLDTAALRVALSEMRRAEHVRIALVGPVVPAHAVALVAPRVSALVAGARRVATAPELPNELLATHRATSVPLLCLLVRAPAPGATDDDAAALAAATERRLASVGTRVFATRSASFGGAIYVGLLLDADAPGIDDAESVVRESLRDRASFEAEREERRRSSGLARGDAGFAAAELAARGALVTRLALAEPQIAMIVGRPQPRGDASFDPSRRTPPLAPTSPAGGARGPGRDGGRDARRQAPRAHSRPTRGAPVR